MKEVGNHERIVRELDELKEIYESLDEVNQKKLEEVIIMLKTKFSQRIRA